MTSDGEIPGSGGTRRRNSVAPNPWRRGRRRPSQNGAPSERQGDSLQMLAGLFADASHAERAYQSLFARGYRHEEVIVMMPETVWQALFAADAAAHGDPGAKGAARRESHDTSHVSRANSASEFSVPVPIPVASGVLATRVMAAGNIAATLSNEIRRPGDDVLGTALAACGVPRHLTRGCAAGVEEGKILVGVMPRTVFDARAIADEWARQQGRVCSNGHGTALPHTAGT